MKKRNKIGDGGDMKNTAERFKLVTFIILLIGVAFMFFTFYNDSPLVKASKQLVVAIENNDLHAVSEIVKQDPKVVNTLPSSFPWWWEFITEQPDVYYPLQEACAWGNYDIVKLLIDNGADINLTWKGINSSSTPLIMAIRYGGETTVDIVILLLEHGADKSIIDKHGKTAYDYALESGVQELIELLKP
jgi:hypothetical protein